MNVAQFFDPLLLRPNVEVIEPRHPEWIRENRTRGAPGLADVARPENAVALHRTNKAQLEGLHRERESRPLRFCHQQVNMLRHHDISENDHPIPPPHALQNLQEQVTAFANRQQRLALIATECQEMKISLVKESVQALRHGAKLNKSGRHSL